MFGGSLVVRSWSGRRMVVKCGFVFRCVGSMIVNGEVCCGEILIESKEVGLMYWWSSALDIVLGPL